MFSASNAEGASVCVSGSRRNGLPRFGAASGPLTDEFDTGDHTPTTEFLADLTDEFGQQGLVVPGRLADELLESLTQKPRRTSSAKSRSRPTSRLNAVAGVEYPWDGYGESLRQIDRPRVKDGFRPKRLSWAVRRMFEEYEAEYPDRTKLTPHDLRDRAITILVEKTQSIDAPAEALNVTAATIKRHYLDRQKAFRSQELLKKMAEVLVPPTAPATGGDSV